MGNILKKGNVEIGVYTKGAELYSYKVNGEEFIWERDSKYWGSSSPILFPFVGVLKNGKYLYKGKEYKIDTRHGFARDNDFEAVEKGEDFLKFKFSSDESTLEKFPFSFDLYLTYVIKNNKLIIQYDVINKTDEKIYFSIGGHPAFSIKLDENIKIDDYSLEFEKKETLDRYVLDGALLGKKKIEKYINNDNRIKLNSDIFNEDALIFENTVSEKVTLSCSKHSKKLILDYKGFPFIAFWSKPKAPFVCIEPWYGITDTVDFTGNLEEKKGILELEEKGRFSAEISIEGINE